MKKSSTPLHSPTKVVKAPNFFYVPDPKYTIDLVVIFGGTFVHAPVAQYVNGASIMFKGVNGIHASEERVKDLCRGYGLNGINKFYNLMDGGFVLMSTEAMYKNLWSQALIHKKTVTIYAELASDVEFNEVYGDILTPQVDNLNVETGLANVRVRTQSHPEVENELSHVNVTQENGGGGDAVDWEDIDIEIIEDGRVNYENNAKNGKLPTLSKKKKAGKKSESEREEDEFFDPDYDYTSELENDKRHSESDEYSESDDSSDESQDYGPTIYNAESESGDEDYLGEADITLQDGDFTSCDSDEELKKPKNKKVVPVKLTTFNEVDMFSPEFKIGTCFTQKWVFRQSVHSHALETQRKLKIYPNDAKRMHVKCIGGNRCKWRLHTWKGPGEDAYVVREYYPTHACNPCPNVKCIKSGWLARKYMKSIACDPKRSVRGLMRQIKKDLDINVTRQQVHRAKKLALILLYGTEEEQVGLLQDYKHEVLSKNPGSTVILDVDAETNIFVKMYVCLAALKAGFKACRPIIGVDGCHLSGEFGGVLLTAVGMDPNNNTYPIAWAVVQSETFEAWSWFLSTLEIDLEMQDHSKWTWMSDKQKGLTKAFETHFKESANRFCVKHLHENMKTAGFTGNATKGALWNLATATTKAQYLHRKDELEQLNPGAAEWLNDRPAKGYCRAFFTTTPHCDMLLNNGCETFNSTILPAREVGIIMMLEWLMNYVMTRFQKNRDLCAERWRGRLCPRIRAILNNNINMRGGCSTFMSTRVLWSVEVLDGDKYVVDLDKKTCTCRRWDLTGIPCRHALCCILENEWDPEKYVHEAYHVKTYKKVYQPVVVPINGRNEWIKTGLPKPLPPNEGRSRGRPQHARKRKDDEPNSKKRKCRGGGPPAISKGSKYKLKKNQKTCTCRYCKKEGHNIKGCAERKADEAAEKAAQEGQDAPFSFDKAAAMEGTAPDKGKEKYDENTNTIDKGKAKEKIVRSVPKEKITEKKSGSSLASSSGLAKTKNGSNVVAGSRSDKNALVGTSIMSRKADVLAPSMWQQMVDQGIIPKNFSKTINMDGATIHMRTTPENVISRNTLNAMRSEKKKSMKK